MLFIHKYIAIFQGLCGQVNLGSSDLVFSSLAIYTIAVFLSTGYTSEPPWDLLQILIPGPHHPEILAFLV